LAGGPDSRWPSRIKRLIRIRLGRAGIEGEVDQELHAHLQLSIDELIASGLPHAAAERQAAAAFGDFDAIAAECGAVRRQRHHQRERAELMHGVAQDIRFALRTIRRTPVFALVAVLTLALGIGTNAAVFSAVRAVLLKPLPFGNPDRLVAISLPKQQSFSKARLEEIRRRQRTLEEIAAYSRWGASLTGSGKPSLLRGAAGTADLFKVLEVSPILGRAFLPGEDRQGNDAVVVISHALWASRFGGDSSLVGQSLTFDGRQRTVVGVTAAGFDFPVSRAEFWLPTVVDSTANDYGAGYLLLVGRLRAGVTPQRAQEDIRRVVATMRADNIGGFSADEEAGITVAPLRDILVGNVRRMLALLLVAAAFILSIACVNVANLLLVRAASRRREFAVRTAIGAGRSRLVRQLLTESLVLSLVSAVVGVASAHGFARVIGGLLPAELIGSDRVVVDGEVLVFAVSLSMAVGVAFGLVPALRVAGDDLLLALRSGHGAVFGGSRRMMSGLVVGEFALASVLAIGAALTVQSFWHLRAEDPGFRSSGVLELRVEPPGATYGTPDRQRVFLASVIARLRAIPGVNAVGAIHLLPLGGSNWSPELVIEGRPRSKDEKLPEVDWRVVTPGYFQTMAITLRRGRLFSDNDRGDAPSVTLINEALAKRDFAGEDPLGRRVRTFFEGKGNWTTIVGVVGSTKDQSLAGPARPQMYRPFEQNPMTGMVLLARTSLPPLTVAPAARDAVWSVDPNVPIDEVQTLDAVVASSIGQPRTMALLLGAFGLLGLLLGAIGIYGVTSYVVSRRTAELGLRMALGAQRVDVVRLVVLDATRLAAGGIALGLLLALGLSRLLRAQLYGVQPTDPWTFAVVAGGLLAVGIVAASAPARRAAGIDPVMALRET
jgi:predicted permease